MVATRLAGGPIPLPLARDVRRPTCCHRPPHVDAIADVWGPDKVPEDADGFRPHVSLAYSNAAGPAEPIIQRLGARSVTAAEITVHRAALIELNRDHKGYKWTDIATADLSTPATPGPSGTTSAGSRA